VDALPLSASRPLAQLPAMTVLLNVPWMVTGGAAFPNAGFSTAENVPVTGH
jgi:hypothetical protein